VPVISYYIVFGFIYCAYLFRIGFLFFVAETCMFWCLCWGLAGRKFFIPILWLLAVPTVVVNEWFKDYTGKAVEHIPPLDWISKEIGDPPVVWAVIFNVTLLRLISYGYDRHWAILAYREKGTAALLPEDQKKEVNLTLRGRMETHQPLERYSMVYFLGYVFYTPLFIPGPITCYNAWISQIFIPQNSYTPRQIAVYCARAVGGFFALEVWMYTMYPSALATNVGNKELLDGLSAPLFAMYAIGSLFFIW
jgi:D-alanyl-lipoteichoic acid acyltransferase DltB (MBOAT superfamily)